MAKTVKIVVSAPAGEIVMEPARLSPYSYQHYPKTAPRIKGTLDGVADHELVLTNGRGAQYLYFRRDGRVEWVKIPTALFEAARAGAPVVVTTADIVVEAKPEAEAPKAKPAKAKRAEPEATAS